MNGPPRRIRQFVRVCVLLALPGVCFAQEPSATFRILGGSAVPGETVTLPVTVETNFPLQGLVVSLHYDTTLLEVTAIDPAWERSDGLDWWFYAEGFHNSEKRIVIDPIVDIKEGYAIAAGILGGAQPIPGTDDFIFIGDVNLLPQGGEEITLFNVTFRVKPDAPSVETEIRFENDGRLPAAPRLENVAVDEGLSIDPESGVAAVLIHDFLNIIASPALFLRGDSSGDGHLDQSDAIQTLSYLFLQNEALPCLDAADTNDDGEVDISDPIAVLSAAFLGSFRIPPPAGAPGIDPTPDGLDCDVSPSVPVDL